MVSYTRLYFFEIYMAHDQQQNTEFKKGDANLDRSILV